jgi:hypothetical protein
MNKLQACVLAALGFTSIGIAQAQQGTQAPTTTTNPTATDRIEPGKTPTRSMDAEEAATPQPSNSQAEGTAADRTQPGKTGTGAMSGSETTVNPQPSTSQAEGTAADRTPPGKTETGAMAGAETTVNPQPSTSPTEGTAADRTAPGKTPTRTAEASGATHNKMVGANVVSADKAPLGTVSEVVFDSKGQPEFVIIAAQGEKTAVPYQAASSMMSGNQVVIDGARLEGAPKVKQGEWQSGSKSWRTDASRYWNEG